MTADDRNHGARPEHSGTDRRRREIGELARRQGFLSLAVASADPLAMDRDVTLERVRKGSFSGLPWFTAERVERAADPRRVLPGARSVLLLLASYAHTNPPVHDDRLRGRISRYAQGRDYHRVLEKRARPLVRFLDEAVPGSRQRVLVDHGPLLERAFARTAGLGWQGKNTLILTRGVGSYAFLAAILTTVPFEPDEPVRQSCGACTRCLPSCPTGAIRSPYEVVSDLCIAHHTIENRGPIPRDLRPAMGTWVFGCDLCQEACPVNEEPAQPLPEFLPEDVDAASPDLVEQLSLGEEEFRRRYAGKPVLRAKYAGFLRNVCIALGNTGDRRAIAPLKRALEHREPLVRGHAAWALGRLDAPSALLDCRDREQDPWVREEIDLALAERSRP